MRERRYPGAGARTTSGADLGTSSRLADGRGAGKSRSAGAEITTIAGKHGAAQSLDRLEAILESRGITVFARVEHGAEAAKVGLALRPTALLIFGNPKAGTPLMVASPSAALDLPLEALAWEDEKGRAWLSYDSPAFLQRRHGLTEDQAMSLAGVSALVQQAAAP